MACCPGLQEDVERLERLNAKDLKQEDKTHKGKLMQGHRVRKRLDAMQDASRKLVRRHAAMFSFCAEFCSWGNAGWSAVNP